MVNGLKIRSERKEDYKIVEEMTRKAFYNLYVPKKTGGKCIKSIEKIKIGKDIKTRSTEIS